MNRKELITIGLIGFGVISAIVTYLAIQAKKLGDYCYNVVGNKITKVGLNQSAFDIYLSVKNKSNINVIVKSYSFNVSINGTYISTIASATPQNLQANSASTFTLSVSFSPAQVLKSAVSTNILSNFILDPSALNISIVGTINIVGTNLITLQDLPININAPLSQFTQSTNTNC